MHLITTRNPVRISATDTMTPGTYLVECISGAQLLCHADGDKMEPLTESRPFDEKADYNDKRILVVRTGGLGDLTLLTPVLREIKNRWMGVKIDVCCFLEFGQAIQQLPFVNEVVKYPMPFEKAKEYDCWIFLENAIEHNIDAEHMHSVDVVAKLIGLTGEFDKRQEYRVTMREAIWAEEMYPRINGTRRICIQANASAKCRTYPQEQLGDVCGTLLKEGWEVFLMAKPGELQAEERPGFRLLGNGLTFRQRCAVIATSDCVLAPDSSLAHIAGALEVPCIALYSVFPWQVRTKYSPTTIGVNGTGACAPCFHHNRMGKEFPEKCPSKARGVCEVLEGIPVKKILALIRRHAKGAEFITSDEITKADA